jgi:hypothetical protein
MILIYQNQIYPVVDLTESEQLRLKSWLILTQVKPISQQPDWYQVEDNPRDLIRRVIFDQ